MSPQDKSQIEAALSEAFNEVYQQCAATDAASFIKAHEDKWSVAENLQHLILSTHPVAKALSLPKLVFMAFGRPKKPSRSYEEVVNYYQQKLKEGAKATDKYVPKQSQVDAARDELLKSWKSAGAKLVANLNGWSENDLDSKFMPHPILGKLTVREMLFFTLYHTGHHLNSIRQLAK